MRSEDAWRRPTKLAVERAEDRLGVATVLAAIVARRQRELSVATGVVSGFLIQVLLAIPKLRVAAAEPRVPRLG